MISRPHIWLPLARARDERMAWRLGVTWEEWENLEELLREIKDAQEVDKDL